MTKVLVLAMITTVTMMSASAFAADVKAGETKSTNCPESSTNVVKAQADGTPAAQPAAPPATTNGAAAH